MDEKRMRVALQLRKAIELLVQTAPIAEGDALAIPDLFEPWTAGKGYTPGLMLKYGEDENGDTNLYSVLQAHTSQTDWTPDSAPSLYKRVGFTDDGIPLWVQPFGAVDAYAKGDKVSHIGFVWESNIDSNVWEPGIYGWSKKE